MENPVDKKPIKTVKATNVILGVLEETPETKDEAEEAEG